MQVRKSKTESSPAAVVEDADYEFCRNAPDRTGKITGSGIGKNYYSMTC
jgi:hypothetical protein